jgi:hypothetical protein
MKPPLRFPKENRKRKKQQLALMLRASVHDNILSIKSAWTQLEEQKSTPTGRVESVSYSLRYASQRRCAQRVRFTSFTQSAQV